MWILLFFFAKHHHKQEYENELSVASADERLKDLVVVKRVIKGKADIFKRVYELFHQKLHEKGLGSSLSGSNV